MTDARPLFGMLDEPRPGHGLIGVSDPDVHHRDGTWSMFIGAFTTQFVVRIVEARLPVGASVADDSWEFVVDRAGRAVELGAPSGRRGWDAAGMHTPSYVRGSVDGREVERIYYAGRSTRKSTGPGSRYAIGYLEYRDGAWQRHSGPVLTGDAARPSALEPFVVHSDGLWRMWFLSAIGEVGRGEQPDYELRYTESVDGTSWGAPERFASVEEGFFDNTVFGAPGCWRMVLARGTNLHGTTPFPSQGLWLTEGVRAPGGRGSWGPVERLLDTDVGAADWYGAGVCGPAAVVDGDVLHVFATGTDVRSWWRAAAGRLRRGRRLPVFAPYFLTTGRFTFHRR
ncbi:hypothetical protein [Actinophytocola gossypii]|uniref:Uncharacterized protein n=1 Tax=Actinophytocola gossypii TaxID=2812003 RepID=A0ABT2J1N5_9PSEU|nr:hypothetical protein [Actinophytocola gossypii]MCT2581718.1 hypothetical protein [Actinophytocola gossypii]